MDFSSVNQIFVTLTIILIIFFAFVEALRTILVYFFGKRKRG